MLTYVVRRVATIVPTLVFVSILIFGLQQLLPGDPAMVLAGEERDPAVIAHLRERLHLDKPFPVRYLYWLGGVVHGDLGESLRMQQPVRALIAEKLPVTLELACIAIVIALAIGIPAGVVSAVRRGTAWDYGANVVALWGLSTPNFWLGIMLILLFAVELGLLPTSGRNGLASLVLPATSLALALVGRIARLMRSSLLEVLNEDYVRTARAKGLPERIVINKHALMNALLPIVTIVGLEFGHLLGGTVIIETVFSWPGIGLLAVQSIGGRDYPVVQAVILIAATGFILINLAVDLLYLWLDPRIAYGRG
jgi:peptide/nickel transport system permease protein